MNRKALFLQTTVGQENENRGWMFSWESIRLTASFLNHARNTFGYDDFSQVSVFR